MKKLIVSLAFSSVLAAGLAVAQGEGENQATDRAVSTITGGAGTMTGGAGAMTGGTGVTSAQCLAYTNTGNNTTGGTMTGGEGTGGTMTGGAMTGGTMTGGTMTGGAMTGGAVAGGGSISNEQAQNAVQSAVACLNELAADIEAGRNAEQAAEALLAIRNDLGLALAASEYVQESEATLAQLELLQQQVRDEQAEAANTLSELVERLNNLPGGGN